MTNREVAILELVKFQGERLSLSEYAIQHAQDVALDYLQRGASAFRSMQKGIDAARKRRLYLVVNNESRAA